MPPDVFAVNGSRVITVALETGGYTLRRGADGRLSEFPFLRQGVFWQVTTLFGRNGAVTGFTAAIPSPPPDVSVEDAAACAETPEMAETLIEIEILETGRDGIPNIFRIKMGEAYYFSSLQKTNDVILEVWYEAGTEEAPEAKPLSVFLLSYRNSDDDKLLTLQQNTDSENGTAETYHYDSMGNLTEIDAEDYSFSAAYNERGLRYWNRRFTRPAENGDGAGEAAAAGETELPETVQKLYLQYDEKPLPVRLSGDSTEAGADTVIDWRYEYDFDARGNWTERREIRMSEFLGVLVAGRGAVVKRVIEYEGSKS
jgi:hypothetical protein